MSYQPPAGDSVNFALGSGYLAPAGDAVNFDLGLVLQEVGNGVEMVWSLVEAVSNAVLIDLPLLAGEIDNGVLIDCVIISGLVGGGVDMPFGYSLGLGVSMPLSYTHDVGTGVLLVWGVTHTVCRGVVVPLADAVEALVGVEIACPLAGGLVGSGAELVYNLEQYTPVGTGVELLWTTVPEGETLTVDVAIVIGGRTMESATGLKLQRRRGEDAISATVDLASGSEYGHCEVGDAAIITLNDVDVVMRVDDKSRSRTLEEWTYSIMLLSPSAWLGSPYADKVVDDYAGLISLIAAEVAGDLAITWDTVDWALPVDRLVASGQYPLDLLKMLAATPGAIINPEWDGSLTVEPRYPAPVPQWTATPPLYTISDIEDIFSDSDDEQWQPGYNRYLVGNGPVYSGANVSLRIEDVAEEDGSCLLRTYTIPHDDSTRMSHSGGSTVSLELVGDESREESDTIAVVDGEGKVGFPAYGLVSADWQERALGSVDVQQDGTVTAAVAGDSLLNITYLTRCRTWRLRNSVYEDVLVTAVTDDKGTGSSITVIVIRGVGDKQGESIQDSLIVNEEVARERGRNRLDETCSPRTGVTVVTPFRELLRTGELVEVWDAERLPWRGLLASIDVDIRISDDEFAGTTTLEIEREAG